MDIGKQRRTIIIAPLELPVPRKIEAPTETPIATPERVPVLVPA